ncbi:hypothetical protein HPB49_002654 [Dermacentor silvarum]|uniref:Uncharacterized protein n=1 Tax=Dermacentor silvarum TaxID=543639 RepID=A0ACB8D292_DERSI|nr:hypothetical protein HPB49_002654 [Dermacentor silvarum]
MESMVEGELISEEEWSDDSWKSPGCIAQERRHREFKAQGKEVPSLMRLTAAPPAAGPRPSEHGRRRSRRSTQMANLNAEPAGPGTAPTARDLGQPNEPPRQAISASTSQQQAATAHSETRTGDRGSHLYTGTSAVGPDLHGQLGCKKTWHLLRHLLDPGNTKSAARNRLTKMTHQYPGTDAELLAELASRYINNSSQSDTHLPHYVGAPNEQLDADISEAEPVTHVEDIQVLGMILQQNRRPAPDDGGPDHETAAQIGNIPVRMDVPSLEAVENEFPEVMKGGRFRPKECTSRHRVAILVPYRNRAEHLKIFIYNLHKVLSRQQIDYGVFVIEQGDDAGFNRAKLLNVGYVESTALYDYQCFVFHDVDMVPLDDRNVYTCPEQPRHMSVNVNNKST